MIVCKLYTKTFKTMNAFFEALSKNRIPDDVISTDVDLNGYTPMHIVAQNKWSDGVDWLISKGFPIDIQNIDEKYAFEYYPDLRLLSKDIPITRSIWRSALKGNIVIKNTFTANLEDFVLLNNVDHWKLLSHDNMDVSILKAYLDKGGEDLTFINHFKWNTYINKKSVWNYVGGHPKWIGTQWELGRYMMDLP